MAYYVFHQNLRSFGGRTATKNAALNSVLHRVAVSLGCRTSPYPGNYQDGPNTIIAAGFTEVKNAGNAVPALGVASSNLRSTLQQGFFVACGYTALATAAQPEYIAIYADACLQVDYCGQVLPVSATDWTCWIQTLAGAATPPQWQSIPGTVIPDYRGVAFIAGRRITGVGTYGPPIIIGFVHNVFTLSNSNILTGAIDKICTAIGEAFENSANAQVQNQGAGHPDAHRYIGAPVLIGGDWNVAPRDMTPLIGYALRNGAMYVSTTQGNHTYDFWESNVAPAFANGDLRIMDNARNTSYWKLKRTGQQSVSLRFIAVSDHSGIGIDVSNHV